MIAERAVLILALAAVAAYGLHEVRGWRTPAGSELSSLQKRLRAWGLGFLLLALGLWLGGTCLPAPQTRQRTPQVRRQLAGYLAYWTLTVLAAVPLIPLALLDSRENLRRLARERKRIFRETVAERADEGANSALPG